MNSSSSIIYGHQLCDGWSNHTEGALYHLGNTLLFLGYMGGSTAYGCLYIFGFLTPSFLCLTLWGWMTACGLDAFVWNLLLLLACAAQTCHLAFRVHREGLRGEGEELAVLYQSVYLPLGVPVAAFKEIAAAFDGRVVELRAGDSYALEGKTPIDQLSFLLNGRISVSLEGQFLHYIQPHQFLDSPEWESLRPNDEGNFQVTLTAEEDSRYVSWRRRRLYQLLSKERYVARVFSVMLGYDIAEKLYTLNDKLFIKSGVRLDIRLPSLYHVLAPPTSSSSSSPPPGSAGDGGHNNAKDLGGLGEMPSSHQQKQQQQPTRDPTGLEPASPPAMNPSPQPQPPQPLRQPSPQGGGPAARKDDHHQPPPPRHASSSSSSSNWAPEGELPSGEDSTSLVLEDFADVAGSLDGLRERSLGGADNNGSIPPRFWAHRGRAPLAPTDTPKL